MFASEQEARDAVRALQNRNAARAKIERGLNAGVANGLGGAHYLPHADLVAQADEESKLREEKIKARLALAEERAAKQQAEADKIRAELPDAPKMVDTPSGEWVRHSEATGIQQRGKRDGSIVYRRRTTVAGKTLTSPSCPTLEEAVAREPGDQPAQTPEPLRVGVGVVDPDDFGLPT